MTVMYNGDRLQRIETWKFNVKGLKLINLICACADSHFHLDSHAVSRIWQEGRFTLIENVL